MQATFALLPRLVRSLSTGQRPAPEQQQQDGRRRSRSESTRLELPSTLHNAVPSLPPNVANAPDAHPTILPTESETAPEAHSVPVPESPSKCATMDPIDKIFDDSLAITPVIPASSDRADQVHAIETNATLPIEERHSHSLDHPEENDGIDNQIDLLQKLATDHMTAVGLRSDAQEQGKALRRLYDQSFDKISSVVAVIREQISSQGSTGSAETRPLSDHLVAISSLLSSVEKARKTFHNSQEHLLSLEWRMKEKEKQLYAQHSGKQAPVPLDDLSDSVSDLASVSLPSTLDEDQHDAAFPEQDVPSIQYGIPVFEGLKGNIEVELKEALLELGMHSSTPLRNDHNEAIQLLVNDRLYSESPSLVRTEVENMSLPVRNAIDQSTQALAASGRLSRFSNSPVTEARLRQYGSRSSPAEFSYLGSWLIDDSEDMTPAKQNLVDKIALPSERMPTSDYTASGMSTWLAYGVPWSSFTAGGLYRSYRLPGGLSTLHGLTINNYESVALGLPMSSQRNIVKGRVDEDFRATRSLLLHNWLWDPNVRFNYPSSILPTIGQPGLQMQRTQLKRLVRTTSEESSDSGEISHRRVTPGAPITAYSINTVHSNPAVSRNSSRARSLP